MMRDIYLGVRFPFESEAERYDSEDVLLWILGFMSRANLLFLLRYPQTKTLYDANVVYAEPDQLIDRSGVTAARLGELVQLAKRMGLPPEEASMMIRIAKGMEIFVDIPELYRQGKGDCNKLVPVRVAELWRSNIMASPYLVKEKNSRGGWSYHATVWYPQDDSIEDPSRILGMGGPEANEERLAEIAKNEHRWANAMLGARELVAAGFDPDAVGAFVDGMGFVPHDGVFRLQRAA